MLGQHVQQVGAHHHRAQQHLQRRGQAPQPGQSSLRPGLADQFHHHHAQQPGQQHAQVAVEVKAVLEELGHQRPQPAQPATKPARPTTRAARPRCRRRGPAQPVFTPTRQQRTRAAGPAAPRPKPVDRAAAVRGQVSPGRRSRSVMLLPPAAVATGGQGTRALARGNCAGPARTPLRVSSTCRRRLPSSASSSRACCAATKGSSSTRSLSMARPMRDGPAPHVAHARAAPVALQAFDQREALVLGAVHAKPSR
jgi:hypothetical protein